jgi:glutamate racemase
LNKENFPIGIFDSGIGGLTVAHAIKKALPDESLIYFGDTAHLPYGEKSKEAIQNYSSKICEFLLEKKCKVIVIACNTASSLAYETVKKLVGQRAIVIDVINPVVDAVCSRFNDLKIGVIATKGTIGSDIYSKKILKKNSSLEVASLATPLLVPMIEEGFFNNNISRTIINTYLSDPKIKNIQALILACTHYPLIKNEIEEYYNDAVTIIDSAQIVASFVKDVVDKNHLKTTLKVPKHLFYVSDYTASFEESTKLFFKGKIQVTHYPLWD